MNKKNILLISSILVFPFTYAIFQLSTILAGVRAGYFLGFIFYWAYLTFFIFLTIRKQKNYLKELLKKSAKTRFKTFYIIMALIPLIAIFVKAFLPYAEKLTFKIAVLVVISAVLNGSIEEIYWRGLYLKEYPKDIPVGILGSQLLFALWHVSLWFIKGMEYEGGFVTLVGGALIMGLLWRFVSHKLQSIRVCIVAHMLVNIFAFSGLYIVNGF